MNTQKASTLHLRASRVFKVNAVSGYDQSRARNAAWPTLEHLPITREVQALHMDVNISNTRANSRYIFRAFVNLQQLVFI